MYYCKKRSQNKKIWPNKWDATVGGHVNAGEFGIQTIIRECKEELGIDVKENEIKYDAQFSTYNLISNGEKELFNTKIARDPSQ